MNKPALGLAIVSVAVILDGARPLEPRAEFTKRWCISGQCPTPTDAAGQVARIRAGIAASSNMTSTWQIGSTQANIGPWIF